MSDKRPDYEELTAALAAGPIQPWQRDASFPDGPEVGRAVCLGCLARKAAKELPRHRKPYRHTCLEAQG